MSEFNHNYHCLESDDNRRALVADIKKIRQEAFRLVDIVPHDHWYEPRYHGWSLGAMLAHLHFMDNTTLRMMQAAERGIALPLPRRSLNLFNNSMSRVFKRRDVEDTLHDIQLNEARLVAFVLRVPKQKLGRKVYDPALERYLTIADAMQEFFFIHWQGHLQTVREVEDQVFYEPSAVKAYTV